MSFRTKWWWMTNDGQPFTAPSDIYYSGKPFVTVDGTVFEAWRSALMEIKSYPYFNSIGQGWNEKVNRIAWYYAPAPTN